MGSPSTIISTPPQAPRIGQTQPPTSVVLQAFADSTSYPQVAYPNQLVIDNATNTLAYFDQAGGWQSVVGGNGGQTFVGPTAPVSGMNLNDQWIDTADDNQINYWNGSAWTPLLIGTNAIANTVTGTTIQTGYAGSLRMWMSGQEAVLGGTAADVISLWFSTGMANEITPAALSLAWNGTYTNSTFALSTGSPTTAIQVRSAPISATIGTTVSIAYGSRRQDFTVSSPVTAGDTTINVNSLTANYAYPVGTYVTIHGGQPSNTTAVAGLLLTPPVFTDTPAADIGNTGLEVTQWTNAAGTSSDGVFTQVAAFADQIFFSRPNVTQQMLGMDSNGTRVGIHSSTSINGIDFGGQGSATTDGGGFIVQSHNLGVTPKTILVTTTNASLGVLANPSSANGAGFTLQFYDSSTKAALASTNVGYWWLAIA